MNGVPAHFIANSVALSVAAGIPGAVLASAQGGRFGSLRPIALAACLRLIAAFLVPGAYGVLAFSVAGILYFFSSCYSVAYQCTLINFIDANDRAVPIAGAFAFFGSTGGAVLPALFGRTGVINSVVRVVTITTCLSAALYALSWVIDKRMRCATSREYI